MGAEERRRLRRLRTIVRGAGTPAEQRIITRNGESYVAFIDADRLDDYHRLERERIHRLLFDDVRRGLEDIGAGRTQDADAAIAAIRKRRTDDGDAGGRGSVRSRSAPGKRG